MNHTTVITPAGGDDVSAVSPLNETGAPRLVVFLGLPASGKSTLAHQLAASDSRWVYLSRDALSATLFGGERSEHNHAVLSAMSDAAVAAALSRNVGVIVDNTNLNPRAMRTLVGQARRHRAELVVVDMTGVPLEVCLARNAARAGSARVPDEAIVEMHSRFVAGGVAALAELDRAPAAPRNGRPHQDRRYVGETTVEHHPALPGAVICDLDGTLAVIGDRDVFDGAACASDRLNATTWSAVRSWRLAHPEHRLVLLTGRKEHARAATVAWLASNGVSFDELLMRPDHDNRPDHVFKKDVYRVELEGRFNVHLVWEDRPGPVEMWRSLGIACHQVDPGQ